MEENILLLDNEYQDISDLEEIIKTAIGNVKDNTSRKLEFLEDASGAMDYLLDLKKGEKNISAIIADEHLYSEIGGSDFLRLCRGYLVYSCTKDSRYLNLNLKKLNDFDSIEKICEKGARVDKEFINFLKNFSEDIKDYVDFVQYFLKCNPLIIMLCGHPTGVDTTGLEDVPLIQKKDGCEYYVLDLLEGDGIFSPQEIEPVLNNHYRLSDPNNLKKLKYNPSSKHIKKRIKQKKSSY